MTQLLVIGFLKAIRGKAYLKINLLVETPLHRRSMEVRRSGLWAPGQTYYWLLRMLTMFSRVFLFAVCDPSPFNQSHQIPELVPNTSTTAPKNSSVKDGKISTYVC